MVTPRKFLAHPLSAAGDFYVIEHECVSCGAPHAVAPDLIGWADPEFGHCIWKKQPATQAELERAFTAFDACCVGCYRYAGSDPSIMRRIGLEYCDQAGPQMISRFRRLLAVACSLLRKKNRRR